MAFRDGCACGADLHVCRNCIHHDPASYNECREPGAERVAQRDRANRCEWFAPQEANPPASTSTGRAALDALFKKQP